jgi:hypothetical protein
VQVPFECSLGVGNWFNVGGADEGLSHLGKNLWVSAPIIIARSPMEFVIWVESRLAGKTLSIQRVASVERSASGISPEEIGLTLADGKTVLKQVQASIVRTQVNVLDTSWRLCRDCHGQHRVKDRRGRELRTIFGIVKISCRRYVRCDCRGGKPGILWALGMMELKRNTPELSFLLAKWGSNLPYRRAAQLLGEFLPISATDVSYSTLRRHALAVGAHIDQRITEPQEYDWPESQREPVPTRQRLTVAIDGTYVRSNLDTGLYQHYVVSGRIEGDGVLGGRFAWIARSPADSVEQMKAALEGNGWTSQSTVVVLADGADGLRSVVQAAIGTPPRSILDWFHIAMRLRHIEQMAPNVAAALWESDPSVASMIEQKLPRLRYQMWNGKWQPAMHRMRDIYRETRAAAEHPHSPDGARVRRFRKHLLDLRDYLRNNWSGLTNYTHAYRHRLRISSAPAESSMSHVVNQRMGKRQPMCWSMEGAHFLLQVRCAVLDGRLETLFREWHPRFRLAPAAVRFPAM